jgi:DNA-directed RNA polymerase subunit N (RpoN/RPB10)
MLIIICHTCGELLGNKAIVYNKEMKKICAKYNVDYNYLSKCNNKDYLHEKKELVNKLASRYCCKMSIVTFTNKVEFVE